MALERPYVAKEILGTDFIVIQCGEKKVKCPVDAHKVSAQDSVLVAMTVEYKDRKENWTEVTKFTYKFWGPFLLTWSVSFLG